MRLSRTDFDNLVKRLAIAERNIRELTQVVANNRRVIQTLVDYCFAPDDRYLIDPVSQASRTYALPFDPGLPGAGDLVPIWDWSIYNRSSAEHDPVTVSQLFHHKMRSEFVP